MAELSESFTDRMGEASHRGAEVKTWVAQGPGDNAYGLKHKVCSPNFASPYIAHYTLSSNQTHLVRLLEDWSQKSMQNGHEIATQMRALDSQLLETQNQLSRIHNDAYWSKLDEQLSTVSLKVQQMSKRHTIIESLRYERMEVRHGAIKDAHRMTSDWIFDSGIGYAEWLQNGSGVYWITGKPGKLSALVSMFV